MACANNNSNTCNSRPGNAGNKLRTYKLFKRTYQTEHYCNIIMPKCHRSAFAKFRCGVAPLRLETGRYEGLPVNERICPFCRAYVENETHVIINCETYECVRESLFQTAVRVCPDFNLLTEKMIFLFSNSSMIRECAKACWLILQHRSALSYKYFLFYFFLMYCLHTYFPFWIELRILISCTLMFEPCMILFYTYILFPGKSVSDGLQERPFRVPLGLFMCGSGVLLFLFVR